MYTVKISRKGYLEDCLGMDWVVRAERRRKLHLVVRACAGTLGKEAPTWGTLQRLALTTTAVSPCLHQLQVVDDGKLVIGCLLRHAYGQLARTLRSALVRVCVQLRAVTAV